MYCPRNSLPALMVVLLDRHITKLFMIHFLLKRTQNGLDAILLAFSPMDVESNQCADNHIEFLKWVIENYGKTLNNVVVLCGDNCSTAKNQIGFVGCASHRFNIFVRCLITRNESACEHVRKIMKKLSCPVVGARLRDFNTVIEEYSEATQY